MTSIPYSIIPFFGSIGLAITYIFVSSASTWAKGFIGGLFLITLIMHFRFPGLGLGLYELLLQVVLSIIVLIHLKFLKALS